MANYAYNLEERKRKHAFRLELAKENSMDAEAIALKLMEMDSH